MTRPSPLERLIAALQDSQLFDHEVERFQVFETHISFVLLTGPYAYKFKKPVDLGFLDFSTLERRRYFCEEELRLNRRLAPDIYVGLVAVTGSLDAPRLNGPGAPFEYAVKMVQFPPANQLDIVTRGGGLHAGHVDQLADDVAAFHARADTADAAGPYGDFESVAGPIRQNFERLAGCCEEPERADRLRVVRGWSEDRLRRDAGLIAQRRAGGAVRECHGDLHLGNMVLYQGRVVVFDCIEFNPELRWIDTMSDAAFLVMDLHSHDLPRLAHRFLNRYLERTGDYQGLGVLDHYLVYRAMVRAKVACIRAGQADVTQAQHDTAMAGMDTHLRLAQRLIVRRDTSLIITRGLSGSGKTVVSGALLEWLGAVRVRSDVERKRLAGLDSDARTGSALDSGLYSRDMSGRTYDRLLATARAVLESGYPAIIDAAFLEGSRRERFRSLADALGVGFVILDVHCAEAELRRRVLERERSSSDASEAGIEVLEHQLTNADALGRDELQCAVRVDTDGPVDAAALAEAVRARR